jgi:hypothetical protein
MEAVYCGYRKHSSINLWHTSSNSQNRPYSISINKEEHKQAFAFIRGEDA